MEKTELICISCPVGCRITVTGEVDDMVIEGNACPRGKEYAKSELTDPRRMVTCLVKVSGAATPLSVKTASAIPKAKIDDCINEIKALKLKAPIEIGSIVLKNAAGTGIDVVATKSV